MVTMKRYCRRVTLGVVGALSVLGDLQWYAQAGLTITGVGKFTPSGYVDRAERHHIRRGQSVLRGE